MAFILASVGSLGSAAVSAAAGNGTVPAAPITAESIYWPAWTLVIGVLLALLIVIGILGSLKTALLAKPRKRDAEFTRMLCRQVWEQTGRVSGTFAERLRQPQRDVVTLRVLARLLREDLAAPVNFVEQMRPHAPEKWPDYALFAAFNNWSGQLGAIETQIADMQQMLAYPVVKEPVDAHRDAMLVYYYTTEQATIGSAIARLTTYAMAICEAAKKVFEKEPSHGFSALFGGKGDEDHRDDTMGCPSCGSAHVHAPFVSNHAGELLPLPEPPEKPGKKEEPKHESTCYCLTPSPCHCARATCICMCNCKPVDQIEHAHH